VDPPPTRLPPHQQLVAPGKWPSVGEHAARPPAGPWRVAVRGALAQPLDLSLDDLRALTPIERAIDIHCVTRWSKLGVSFRGVLLAELLAAAGPEPSAKYVSFVAYSARNHSTSLTLAEAIDLDTIIAWECEGQALEASHGGPVRVVVPGRYFYKSLKWLRAIELLSDDSLGYWEREAGYHNTGDPWHEQRYMLPNLSRQQVQAALTRREFAGLDLRSLDARSHDLTGLNARGALLRDADFRNCRLVGANFNEANLSNARLGGAVLAGARFIKADVEGADFSGADLRGADFTGAALLGVSFFTDDADAGPRAAAVIDASTVILPAALEALLPLQAEFVNRALARPVAPLHE
jgi:DMSO/TMAO reductase YedYZ molybdopterin-dependent catalytic subunit